MRRRSSRPYRSTYSLANSNSRSHAAGDRAHRETPRKRGWRSSQRKRSASISSETRRSTTESRPTNPSSLCTPSRFRATFRVGFDQSASSGATVHHFDACPTVLHNQFAVMISSRVLKLSISRGIASTSLGMHITTKHGAPAPMRSIWCHRSRHPALAPSPISVECATTTYSPLVSVNRWSSHPRRKMAPSRALAPQDQRTFLRGAPSASKKLEMPEMSGMTRRRSAIDSNRTRTF